MQTLTIAITKRRDGQTVLKCTRVDGSETWQKNSGTQAAFFVFHDLTHYVVETELRLKDAFFGLIAQGWSVEETTGKGERGPLPVEAWFAELVVGILDQERVSFMRWSAEEFNDALSLRAASSGRSVPLSLTQGNLDHIRQARSKLFEEWHGVPDGGTLQLVFQRLT